MLKSSIVFLILNFIGFTYGQTVAPGTWSGWADHGCTDTCGMCGVVQQIRICLSPPCIGAGTQNTTTPCGSPVCIFPRPACCLGSTRGVQNGQIACISNNGPGTINSGNPPSPTPAPGTWSSWTNDGCTDTCGMCGYQRKTRACLVPNTCIGPKYNLTTETCGSAVCSFPRQPCCNGLIRVIQNGQFACA